MKENDIRFIKLLILVNGAVPLALLVWDQAHKRLGANPQENDHIDLFARIPEDGSFIFEMKSGGESILEQIRKGLSQLYEYRYRYRGVIGGDDIALCLVLPEPPATPWVADYLCNDRDINICWFEGEGDNLAFHELCAEGMAPLVPPA